MTTPAQNVDSVLTGTGDAVMIYHDGTQVPNGTFLNAIRRTVRKRPESSNKPVVNGWRGMTNWFHSWGYGSSSLGSTSFRRGRTNPGQVSEYVYFDGCFWGTSPFTRPPAPDIPSGMKSKCEIEALNKLTGSEFNLGVFLAEAKESSRTISETAERIACEVTSFRRQSSRSTWQKIVRFEGTPRWREIPRQWLALQYGWKPMLQDVAASMAKLEQMSKTHAPVIKVTGSAKQSFDRDVRIGSAIFGGCTQTYRQKWIQSSTCTLYYALVGPQLAALSSLGLVNPLSIAWERLPYSFVVDWFVPVGSWISSLTAHAGFAFQSGCFSQKSTCTEEFVVAELSNSALGPDWTGLDNSRFIWSEGNSRRDVYTSSPVPGLYVKSPFSATHVANALALLSASFR